MKYLSYIYINYSTCSWCGPHHKWYLVNTHSQPVTFVGQQGIWDHAVSCSSNGLFSKSSCGPVVMSHRDARNTVVLGLKVNSEEISASLRFLHELCTAPGVPPLAPAPSPKPATAWVELTHSHQVAQVILQLPHALSPAYCNVCVYQGAPGWAWGCRMAPWDRKRWKWGNMSVHQHLPHHQHLKTLLCTCFKKWFLAFTLRCSLQSKGGRNEPLQINDFALWWTTLPFPMWRCSKGLKGLEHIEAGNEDWIFSVIVVVCVSGGWWPKETSKQKAKQMPPKY